MMFALVLVTALLLTGVVLPSVAIAGWRPDLVALTVAAFGFTDGPETGMRYGFLAGLASDLLGGADQLVGLTALVLLLVGYASGQARPHLTIATLGGTVLAGGLAGGLASVGQGLLTFMLDPARLSAVTMLESILVTGLYSALLAPFVVRPVAALSRRIRPASVADVGGRPARR
jgi:rod shape-determining protein MreD